MDYLSEAERKLAIQDILTNEENLRRKESSLMRFEMYMGRQSPFVLQRMLRELGRDAVQNARTITSINIVKKLINEQAAVYKEDPTRAFENCNEKQEQHLLDLYDYASANVKMKKTNRIFKANSQSALQVIPKNGKMEFRPLWDHHYDVIPKTDDPEVADAFIISGFDKTRLMNRLVRNPQDLLRQNYFADTVNQKIGEPDDYKGKQFFYWWTKDFNFITDKDGKFVDSNGNHGAFSEQDVLNPIQKLPFIDVSAEKDFEYFVRGGSSAFDFNLDLLLMLSDISEINRLQGFSQAVIASTEEPKDLRVGPRRVLFLKIKPNAADGERPTFQFVSPSPDLASSLKFLSDFTSLFLTSEGMSPKLVNTMGEKESFTSGLDRFLAGVEKFDASRDDFSLFKRVEHEAFELVKLWNNQLYSATENGFIPELSGVSVPEDSYLNIKFKEPSMLLGEKEKLDVISQKTELGLISRLEAVMMDREIDKDAALEVLKEIDETAEEIILGNA